MEDFDVFTDEINFTKPLYMNILNKFVKDVPATPSGPNYQSGQKLMGEECLVSQNEAECAFHLSEAVSSTLRNLPVYRDEQTKCTGDKLYKIKSSIKTVNDIVNSNPIPKDQMDILAALTDGINIDETLKEFIHEEELPFHKQYLRFGPVNNVDNFRRILGELPKEWTVVQLTAPYNPHENTKTLEEYRTEIDSICVSVFTNEYFDDTVGPITISIPANAVKEGEKPLFTELYSLLDENYQTLNSGQFYNNKRLVQSYWSKREDVDLRMKSVIQAMDKKWLGGWGALLTGRLEDTALRDRVRRFVDDSIADWGFIKLTNKQKVLLYNLIGSSPNLLPEQIKSCIRRILTEHGNIDDIRRTLDSDCQTCTPSFRLPNELCFQCLSKCFQKLHHFTLADGIRAFTETAKESLEWECLKEARRYPVILIVDETLDQFPWETLPILNRHPVCRMENIHFLYYLYKTHEKDIVDGYFMTKSAVGRYVINPEKNLDRMEKRMSSFISYWCGGWRGRKGEPPSTEELLRYIAEADVFLYCGHGDGFALTGSSAGTLESSPCHAVSILAGCGSTRLVMPSARAPASAAHHRLYVAGCPAVVGMLWEVTDLEVDKVISALIARAIKPSNPTAVAWQSVGKAKWTQGILETDVDPKTAPQIEGDLLRAITRARGASSYVMIASTVVARGLPVKIQD